MHLAEGMLCAGDQMHAQGPAQRGDADEPFDGVGQLLPEHMELVDHDDDGWLRVAQPIDGGYPGLRH